MEKEVKFVDYVAIAIVAVAAVVKGLYTTFKQLPTYVSANFSSSMRDIERVQKSRVDGKTPRERRIEAVYGVSTDDN